MFLLRFFPHFILESKLGAGQNAVGFEIFVLGGFDHLLGQGGRRRGLVPRLSGQPVAEVLLVEARLALARLIALGWPEAGGVGRQHFVDEDQLAVDHAEFELGGRQ